MGKEAEPPASDPDSVDENTVEKPLVSLEQELLQRRKELDHAVHDLLGAPAASFYAGTAEGFVLYRGLRGAAGEDLAPQLIEWLGNPARVPNGNGHGNGNGNGRHGSDDG